MMYPNKFTNVTNGITPRRWLLSCNPLLSNLISKTLGSDDFLIHLDQLKGITKYADDASFQKKWMAVKIENKKRLAKYIKVRDIEYV
jgi:starch phosphorylase